MSTIRSEEHGLRASHESRVVAWTMTGDVVPLRDLDHDQVAWLPVDDLAQLFELECLEQSSSTFAENFDLAVPDVLTPLERLAKDFAHVRCVGLLSRNLRGSK
jgi:hypothetical protein